MYQWIAPASMSFAIAAATIVSHFRRKHKNLQIVHSTGYSTYNQGKIIALVICKMGEGLDVSPSAISK